MQISEQTRWWVTVSLGVAGIVVALIIGLLGIKALNSAFRQAESTIESGFSRTELTIDENTAIVALGSKGDRPAWANVLRKAKGEAIEKGGSLISSRSVSTLVKGQKLRWAEVREGLNHLSILSFHSFLSRGGVG
ncbi:TPA: hypothetical protein EYP66_25550 [Candidatus Poribacteria bacterium]|nr:hypothetical protein [Candidatus Poribacteria bacterium]